MTLVIDPKWDGAFQNLVRYFHALEVYDIDAGLSCFSPNVEYWHHPFNEVHEGFEDDDKWHCARGHGELRKLWEFRGPEPQAIHHLSGFARNGNLCFCEGFTPGAPGEPPVVTWISAWTVDPQNIIERYTAYIQWPSVALIGDENIPCK